MSILDDPCSLLSVGNIKNIWQYMNVSNQHVVHFTCIQSYMSTISQLKYILYMKLGSLRVGHGNIETLSIMNCVVLPPTSEYLKQIQELFLLEL